MTTSQNGKPALAPDIIKESLPIEYIKAGNKLKAFRLKGKVGDRGPCQPLSDSQPTKGQRKFRNIETRHRALLSQVGSFNYPDSASGQSRLHSKNPQRALQWVRNLAQLIILHGNRYTRRIGFGSLGMSVVSPAFWGTLPRNQPGFKRV
jgi:hypothetical protein